MNGVTRIYTISYDQIIDANDISNSYPVCLAFRVSNTNVLGCERIFFLCIKFESLDKISAGSAS